MVTIQLDEAHANALFECLPALAGAERQKVLAQVYDGAEPDPRAAQALFELLKATGEGLGKPFHEVGAALMSGFCPAGDLLSVRKVKDMLAKGQEQEQ